MRWTSTQTDNSASVATGHWQISASYLCNYSYHHLARDICFWDGAKMWIAICVSKYGWRGSQSDVYHRLLKAVWKRTCEHRMHGGTWFGSSLKLSHTVTTTESQLAIISIIFLEVSSLLAASCSLLFICTQTELQLTHLICKQSSCRSSSKA